MGDPRGKGAWPPFIAKYPPTGACVCRSRSPVDPDAPPTSRRRSYSPPSKAVNLRVEDADPVRRAERERQLAARMAAVELEKDDSKGKKDESSVKEFDAKAEFAKLTGSRSGGVYMPPARLRAMREAASSDRASAEYQRLSWDALRKSITGIVNRVNIANIKHVVPELFAENLIRGRGLFSRSIMKAQSASLPFTPVFAALVAIINTKLPQVGELVLVRLVSQFRRAFKRNDKVNFLPLSVDMNVHMFVDRVPFNHHVSCAPRQPKRSRRYNRSSNSHPASRETHRRLHRDCGRLNSRSWRTFGGKLPQSECGYF